jgi:hypothetical protein
MSAAKKHCEVCGAIIIRGTYCWNCREKLKLWTTIQAMVIGCAPSQVKEKRKIFLEERKHGKRK